MWARDIEIAVVGEDGQMLDFKARARRLRELSFLITDEQLSATALKLAEEYERRADGVEQPVQPSSPSVLEGA